MDKQQQQMAMPIPNSKPHSSIIDRAESTSPIPNSGMALEDGMIFLSYAAQALSRDEFSSCFEPKPTLQPTHPLLYWMYLIGLVVRYGILFPMRLAFLICASVIFILLLPICVIWRDPWFMRLLFRGFSQAWLISFTALIRHHGVKPDPEEPHLFVANHTSFIDYFLISSHGQPHATVAQIHGGLFGYIQRYALSLNGSLFFNRNERKDRAALSRKMQNHINKRPQITPLIIFPEGTCVNNESTVLFHKGAFEMDADICPIAIKYNKRLLDPYWNTREQTFTQHALYLMTRWFMIADVWWLPPQRRLPSETAIEFANRVKGMISETAGLRNLSWDGYMKNCMRQQDHEKMRKCSQERYVHELRKRLTPLPALESDGALDISNLPPAKSRNMLGTSMPAHIGTMPYLPSWLPEPAIVDIQNELLVADSKPSKNLLDNLRDRKDDVIKTWRFYSKLSRHSPMTSPRDQDGKRIENSSWRLWFKQKQEAHHNDDDDDESQPSIFEMDQN